MIKESGGLTYKCNSLGKGDIGGGIDIVIERDRGIVPMLGGVFKTVDLTHGELCVIAVANAPAVRSFDKGDACCKIRS